MRTVVALLLCLAAPFALADGVGVFTEVKGDTRVLRGQTYLAAEPGVDVNVDDIIETGAAASAQLDMNDGSLLKLGAGSRVRLADYKLDGERNVIEAGLEVLSGWMRFAVAKMRRTDGRYAIRTPTMTIGIRGTGGVIEAADAQGGLLLEEGEVTVGADGASSLPVRAGEFVERRAGRAFNRPGAVPAAFRARMPQVMHQKIQRRAHLLKQRALRPRVLRQMRLQDRERYQRVHPQQRQHFERRTREQRSGGAIQAPQRPLPPRRMESP
jgi:hypothetical protein